LFIFSKNQLFVSFILCIIFCLFVSISLVSALKFIISPLLSIIWHREALYRLGVQGVKVLILLGALFLPSVAPASQQDF
jgi:hypothetical protein